MRAGAAILKSRPRKRQNRPAAGRRRWHATAAFHARPGDRILLRRDRRRGPRRRRGPARARALQPGRLHRAYGGVVPELASRDHVRRLLPLVRRRSTGRYRAAETRRRRLHRRARAGRRAAHRRGAGARAGLCAGACRRWACTTSRATCWRRCSEPEPPAFPHVALLVSGGHTHADRGRAAWATTACWARPATTPPARPSTRRPSSSGLPYPGGPELAALARAARAGALRVSAADARSPGPRVQLLGPQDGRARMRVARRGARRRSGAPTSRARSRRRSSTRCARKALRALDEPRARALVVAGGVGANRELRARLSDARRPRAARACTIRASSSAPTTRR